MRPSSSPTPGTSQQWSSPLCPAPPLDPTTTCPGVPPPHTAPWQPTHPHAPAPTLHREWTWPTASPTSAWRPRSTAWTRCPLSTKGESTALVLRRSARQRLPRRGPARSKRFVDWQRGCQSHVQIYTRGFFLLASHLTDECLFIFCIIFVMRREERPKKKNWIWTSKCFPELCFRTWWYCINSQCGDWKCISVWKGNGKICFFIVTFGSIPNVYPSSLWTVMHSFISGAEIRHWILTSNYGNHSEFGEI